MTGAPAAFLSTQRLSLAPLTAEDEASISDLLGDSHVRRYLGGPVPKADRPKRFQAYLAPPPGIGVWAVSKAPRGAAFGLILLTPHHNGTDHEVSYQFAPHVWGKGFGTEAVGCVITHALDTLNLPRVVAETQVANTASCRLLARLGLREIEQLERFGAQQALYATPAKA